MPTTPPDVRSPNGKSRASGETEIGTKQAERKRDGAFPENIDISVSTEKGARVKSGAAQGKGPGKRQSNKNSIDGTSVGIADEAIREVREFLEADLHSPSPDETAMRDRGARLAQVDMETEVDDEVRADADVAAGLGSVSYLESLCDEGLDRESRGRQRRQARVSKLPQKVRKVVSDSEAKAMSKERRVGRFWRSFSAVSMIALCLALVVVLLGDAAFHLTSVMNGPWLLGKKLFAAMGVSLSVTMSVVVNTGFLYATWIRRSDRDDENPGRPELSLWLAWWAWRAAMLNVFVFSLNAGLSYSLRDWAAAVFLRQLVQVVMPITSLAALAGMALGLEYGFRKHFAKAKKDLFVANPAIGKAAEEDESSLRRSGVLRSIKALCAAANERVAKHVNSIAADHKAVQDKILNEREEIAFAERVLAECNESIDANAKEAIDRKRRQEVAVKKRDELKQKYGV